MTYEKAKELCKTTLFESEEQERYVLKALDLQIAKLPESKMVDGFIRFTCPNCGECDFVAVDDTEGGKQKDYCDKCGQKLARITFGRNKEGV